MKYNTLYFLLLAMVFAIPMRAQIIADSSLSSDFRAEVKSLDEFMARFNGTESKPGIDNDEQSRRNNIISLFDFKIDKENLSREQFTEKISCFVDSVIVNNVTFDISNSGLYAECVSRMKYKGKETVLTIILHREGYMKDMLRWTIVGVRGIKEMGVYDPDKLYAIYPAEHEVHFLGLDDFLNANPSHAFGYRSKKSEIDDLSVFFTLISVGELKFDIVENQSFYYFDIPGYVIRISEVIRRGNNSGWLITSFDKVSIREKEKRLKKLLGSH